MSFYDLYAKGKFFLVRMRDWIAFVNFAMICLLFIKDYNYELWQLGVLILGLIVWTIIDVKYLYSVEVKYRDSKNPIMKETLDKVRRLNHD